MENKIVYVVEFEKEDIDDLITMVDMVVKSEGLPVAERCAQLHKKILSANQKDLYDKSISEKVIKSQIRKEEMSKEVLNKELDSLLEKSPSPKTKKSPAKKSSKSSKKK